MTNSFLRHEHAYIDIVEAKLELTQVGKLTEKAVAKGITVQELVIEAVKRHGSVHGASKELNVAPNTIQYHLRQAGMKLTVKTIVKLEKVS